MMKRTRTLSGLAVGIASIAVGLMVPAQRGLAAPAVAAPAVAAPIVEQDFEADAGGWTAGGAPGARVSITHDAADVKQGQGALRFDYKIQQGGLSALQLPVQKGSLAKMQSLHFWLRAERQVPIVVGLSEENGGHYNAIFTAPAGLWQEVRLAPSDFTLGDGPTDPKDPDGKLDPDQVNGISIVDMSQFFAQNLNPGLAGLLHVTMGPQTLLLDSFAVLPEAPPRPAAREGAISIDDFQEPQLSWLGLGESQMAIGTGQPLNQRGLQATYHQGQGLLKLVAWMRAIQPGALAGAARLSFPAASGVPIKLLVQVEETDGGKYNTSVDIPGGAGFRRVSVAFANFKAANDSHDTNNKLDLDKVKQLLLVDLSGMLTGAEADNTLWVGPIAATLPRSPGQGAAMVTGRVVRASDGKPISGAAVSLSEGDDPDPLYETQSLVNGSFILRAAPGDYRLRAVDSEHVLYESDLEVPAGGAPAVEVKMDPRPVIHLRVLGADGIPVQAGAAEAAARVTAPTGTVEATTAQEKMQNGVLDISFDHPVQTDQVRSISLFVRDPVAGCADLTLDHWPTTAVDAKLAPGASITGDAVDAAHKPFANVPVIAFRMNGLVPDINQHAFTVTDAAGKFTITALPAGAYGVLLKAPTAQSNISFLTLANAPVKLNLVADQKPTP